MAAWNCSLLAIMDSYGPLARTSETWAHQLIIFIYSVKCKLWSLSTSHRSNKNCDNFEAGIYYPLIPNNFFKSLYKFRFLYWNKVSMLPLWIVFFICFLFSLWICVIIKRLWTQPPDQASDSPISVSLSVTTTSPGSYDTKYPGYHETGYHGTMSTMSAMSGMSAMRYSGYPDNLVSAAKSEYPGMDYKPSS